MLAEKISTLVVFMLGAEAGAEPRGPSLGSRWFRFFFFAFHEYHQSFNFFCQHFREYHQKLKNNQWIPGPKNKKIWQVSHEIQHWWFWTSFFWQSAKKLILILCRSNSYWCFCACCVMMHIIPRKSCGIGAF